MFGLNKKLQSDFDKLAQIVKDLKEYIQDHERYLNIINELKVLGYDTTEYRHLMTNEVYDRSFPHFPRSMYQFEKDSAVIIAELKLKRCQKVCKKRKKYKKL